MTEEFKKIFSNSVAINDGIVLIGSSQIQVDRKLEYILYPNRQPVNFVARIFDGSPAHAFSAMECEHLRSELIKNKYSLNFEIECADSKIFWLNSMRDNVAAIWVHSDIHIPNSIVVEWDVSLLNEIKFGGFGGYELHNEGILTLLPGERLSVIQAALSEPSGVLQYAVPL
ncbi:hypothetical protein [Glycocaulis sp.]